MLKSKDRELLRELRDGQDQILTHIAEIMAGQNKLIHDIGAQVLNHEKRLRKLEEWREKQERRTA